MTARDALVLSVVALVALVLIEGMLLVTASPTSATSTSTVTSDGTTTIVSGATATDTITSTATSTVTSDQTTTIVSGATATDTITSTATDTITSTATSTSTSTVTATSTSTETSVSTSTATSTVLDAGPFVVIQPDASKNQSSSGFSPVRLVVVLGVNNTVTWINDDSVDQTVTSTSFSEPFNSGNLSPQQAFAFTFTQPGTFDYVSIYYPWMKGTVVVVGSPSGPA